MEVGKVCGGGYVSKDVVGVVLFSIYRSWMIIYCGMLMMR